MDFRAACHIAYPLSSAINNHLREEERSEDLQAEVERYVRLYTEDRQGINTLRDEMPDVEDLIDKLVLEIVSSPIDSRTIEQVRKFRLSVFVAASKLAGKQIAKDIRNAQEDAAVTAYELRQMERCEP